jgi:hypothetical protein
MEKRNFEIQQKLEAFANDCKRLGIPPTQFALIVNIAEQTISLFEQNKFIKKFPCSTSRFGIGQTEGSNCTPLGLHRIAEKIGAGEPAGTVFKSRQVIGHTSQPELSLQLRRWRCMTSPSNEKGAPLPARPRCF